jgi:hypothetical protein
MDLVMWPRYPSVEPEGLLFSGEGVVYSFDHGFIPHDFRKSPALAWTWRG